MNWLLLIAIVIAIAWIPKLLPRKIGEPLEELGERSIIDTFSLKSRAETAIDKLDYSDLEYDPDRERNQIYIGNFHRAVERYKHNPKKLREIVEDLETLVRFDSRYGGTMYSPGDDKDTAFQTALIKNEEIVRRFKTILGADYKDPEQSS